MDADPDPGEDGAVGEVDTMPSPRAVMKLANSLLTESMIRSIGAVYTFQLEGDEGGTFYLDAKNGKVSSK